MAHRTKTSRRGDRDSDSIDSLKPLIVLGLLGTIMYGAYSVVRKGPTPQPPGAVAGPNIDLAGAVQSAADSPLFTPPDLADPSSASGGNLRIGVADGGAPPLPAFPPASLPPASIPPASLPSGPDMAGGTLPPPTYLTAASAVPPVAEPAPPPGPFPPAAISPPLPQRAPPAMAVGAAPLQGLAVPPSPAFTSAWTDAHDKLAAGRFAEALSSLSVWYDDPSLGLEESQRLEELLGQLAGTVIYSQQDLLLPPHVAAPGDTLQVIAGPLSVPWQLLAKINGVDEPTQLIPGEHLKLVHGPFDAVISVSRRRMSLQVGGNYAGSFPVVIGRQIHERVGSSVAVLDIRRPGVAVDPPGITAQVVYAPATGPKAVILGEGLAIEGVEDPSLLADSASPSSIVVSLRDLEDIADILGAGSQVLVRK
ncbi:MAG: LysM peptidoglycan-binding domain-containing protein [Planctomycetota bacterium]|nr:MAG: LysM peptidoglycan-binding domain-containing protein [Planctomycetota bacterium]